MGVIHRHIGDPKQPDHGKGSLSPRLGEKKKRESEESINLPWYINSSASPDQEST